MVDMAHRLAAIVGAAHAGPTVVVTLVTVLLASASGLEPWRIVTLGVMTVANQLSIGWSNDAIDAARDREAHRTDKPIVRGEVEARLIMSLAAVAAATAIVISLALGPALAVVHLVALAAGWLYNLGLKRGAAATLCYVVGFGLIPLMVTLARADPTLAAWWAIVMGGMLGLAAHFANVLPDLDADRRHGIRSLPHRLGARRAGVVALVVLAAAALLGLIAPGYTTPVTIVGAAATLALVGAGVVVIVRAPESRALFRVIMLAALAVVATLAGSAGAFVV
jgi:4-hydroxybenzoate polyprenyltransferase